MKAVATPENRPAYPFISGTHNSMVVEATHKYQCCIEVVVVFLVKVPVVFVCLLSKFFMETRSSVWLLLRKSGFDCSGQVIAQPGHNVRENSWSNACLNHTSAAHPHLPSGSSSGHHLPRRAFDQVLVSSDPLSWSPWLTKGRSG